jgi:hypothetical protein
MSLETELNLLGIVSAVGSCKHSNDICRPKKKKTTVSFSRNCIIPCDIDVNMRLSEYLPTLEFKHINADI